MPVSNALSFPTYVLSSVISFFTWVKSGGSYVIFNIAYVRLLF